MPAPGADLAAHAAGGFCGLGFRVRGLGVRV